MYSTIYEALTGVSEDLRRSFSNFCRFFVQSVDDVFKSIIRLSYSSSTERVGLYEISASFEVIL